MDQIKKLISKYRVALFIVIALTVITFFQESNKDKDVDLNKFKSFSILHDSANKQMQDNAEYILGEDDEQDLDIMADALKSIDTENIKADNDKEKDLLTILNAQKKFFEKDVMAQEKLSLAQNSIPFDQVLLPQNLYKLNNIEQSLGYTKIMKDSGEAYNKAYKKNLNLYLEELEKNLINKRLMKVAKEKSQIASDLTINANNKAIEGYHRVEELLNYCKKMIKNNSIGFNGDEIQLETDEQIDTYNAIINKININVDEHNQAIQRLKDHSQKIADTTADIFK